MNPVSSGSSRGVDEEHGLTLIVSDRVIAADGVVMVSLRDRDGGELPAWSPGAHIDLSLGRGLVRQYSLCGDPSERDVWRIGVLRQRDSRGGSAFVHDRLHPGVTLSGRGPRNHFRFEGSVGEYLFIAGGIGITPLIPMIAAAEAAGARWVLHYGGRNNASMALRDELSRFDDKVHLYPQDEVGLPDLDAILRDAGPEAIVYCCGPDSLLEAAEKVAARHGLTIRVERFAPKAVAAPKWDGPFEVVLSQTGITITVPPGRSILDVAEDAGAMVVSSCQEGTCGTCETPVLEGIPDHRDSLLTDETNTMMICVSRAACPRLVLDL
ncbi:PDR/VanB family oxidoreductase [Streptomyces malaysiensis]|uniref:Vanillate demethylase reductase subunit n=1 Tax=Streptomyces malaysiensis TaxID=92644 RepID=A0A7X5XA33_STRMQ|nr:PDR/VanB family oxidoreductase [Streptomyces malaysiensis]NIY69418.1 vanillate demethylase reductase subunit [Streptomyces malaysiensis]